MNEREALNWLFLICLSVGAFTLWFSVVYWIFYQVMDSIPEIVENYNRIMSLYESGKIQRMRELENWRNL